MNKNVNQYDVYDSEAFILSIIVMIIKCSNDKIEVIKLFYMITMLLENLDKSVYHKTRNNIVYILRKAKEGKPQFDFILETNKKMNKYYEKIYNCILLGVKIGLLEFSVSSDLILRMKKTITIGNDIRKNDYYKKIEKLSNVFSEDVDYIISNFC